MTFKATFIGDPRHPRDGQNELTFRGIRFERGKAITVPDGVGQKLSGNSHFEVTGYEAGKEVKVPAANQVAVSETDPAPQPPIPSIATSTADAPAPEPHEANDGDDQGSGQTHAAGNAGARGRGNAKR